ncbi:MAG: hypothetical protein AB1568_01015 [Thermodesulfobacteriota bacterium]
MLKLLYCAVLIGSVTLLLGGCHRAESLPETRLISAFPSKGVCRAAVLPFKNQSDHPQGGIIAYRIFTAELEQRYPGMLVLEGDTMRAFRRLQLGRYEHPSQEQLRLIADQLNCSHLFTGTVVRMEERPESSGINPAFAVQLTLQSAADNRIIVSSYVAREGEEYRRILHYGKVNTLTGLVKKTFEEMLLSWENLGLSGCAD